MIRIKKIKPMFTSIVTTMDKYGNDQFADDGHILNVKKMAGALKENQKVVAIGEMVKGIKVGDMVNINPTRYAVMKHKEGSLKDNIVTDNPVVGYNFRTVMIDGNEYLYLEDRDINYVIEEYEEGDSDNSGNK